jgi:hypothetical protein
MSGMLPGLAVAAAALAVALEPAVAADSCEAKARALVEKTRDLAEKRRTRIIELAVRRDVSIVCGVVEQSFFASAPAMPAVRVIPISEATEKDLEPVVFARIETIALRLKDKKRLSSAHRELLEVWMTSAAVSARAAKEHGH